MSDNGAEPRDIAIRGEGRDRHLLGLLQDTVRCRCNRSGRAGAGHGTQAKAPAAMRRTISIA
jgi:hypothetical protein